MLDLPKTINDISVGDHVEISRSWSFDDLDIFAKISHDYNPLHLDDKYAKDSGFSGRVVYGMLIGSACSELVGMYLPGKQCLIMKESLTFRKPLYVGDLVKIYGEVVSKSIVTKIIEVSISVNRNSDIIAEGTFILKVR